MTEAGRDRLAHDVLHVDRLALADERAIEHGVEDLPLLLPAIRQVEVVRADALAPLGQREAEIIGLARRHHQRRPALILAARIGFRLGQARGDAESARGIGSALREDLPGTAVGDPHFGAADALAAVERSDPDERGVAPPFEVHAHIGDERARCDVARAVAAEQGGTESWAGEFDDIESGLGQRDPDDFELLALARQRDLERLARGRREQRFGTGEIDPDRLLAVLRLRAFGLCGIVDRAQPFGDLAVAPLDLEALSADRHLLAAELPLDVAHRDRQHAALGGLEDPEIGGELHQRRGFVEADVEREAFGVGQLASALVGDIGGERQLRGDRSRQRRLELDVGDGRLALLLVGKDRRQRLAVGQGNADRLGLRAGNRRGEAHPRVLHRAAARLRIDPRAFEPRSERLAHREVEALVGARGAATSGDVLAPDQGDIAARGERAPAFERDYAGSGFHAIRFRGGKRLGQPCFLEEALHRPLVGAQPGEHFARHVGWKHVDGNLLADTVDRAIGIGADRRAIRRDIGGDEERLVLLDLAAVPARQHGARDRPAAVDGEFGLAGEGVAGEALQLVLQGEGAGHAAGERTREFVDKGLLVDPTPLAADRAFDRERSGRARIPERHHRLVEPRREPLDRAVADAGRGHLDLRAVVAHRQRRAERCGDQRQDPEPGSELHGSNSPKGARTLAAAASQANAELTGSETE